MAAIELTTTTNVTKTGILTALNAQGHLTQVATNSANWISVNSSVWNTSASWNNGSNAYTSFRANSADFISTETSVYNTSATWNNIGSVNSSVYQASGKWDSVFTHVNTTSGSKFSGTFYTLSSDNVTVATLTFSNGLLVSIAP